MQLVTSTTVSTTAGGYTETITISNTGVGIAPKVTLTSATLGSATGAMLPASLGDLAAGASATVTLTFPASAGADHTPSVARFSGIYTGGSFTGGQRVTLP